MGEPAPPFVSHPGDEFLPEIYDEKKAKRQNKTACQICKQHFKQIFKERVHCLGCGRSVCANCAMMQRALSQDDVQKQLMKRVCDVCDVQLSNPQLGQTIQEILNK